MKSLSIIHVRILSALSVWSMLSSLILAQWRTAFPTSVDVIMRKGETIFIGGRTAGWLSQGVIFRSTDGGISWSACRNGLPREFHSVVSLTQDGTFIYVALADSGVFRSSDEGMNWEIIKYGLPRQTYDTAGVINPRVIYSDGTRLFFVRGSSSGDTLYVSTNGGSVWNKINPSGLPANTPILDIVLFGGALYMRSGYSNSVGYVGVFKSTDNGSSWTEVNSGLPVSKNVSKLFHNGTTLFAQSEDKIFKLSGNTWQTTTTTSISFLTASGATLVGYAGGKVKYSTDQGTTWNNATTNPPIGSVYNIYPAAGNRVFLQSDSGLYASSDNGVTWTRRINSKLIGARAALIENNFIFVSPIDFTSGIRYYLSLDSGKTWIEKSFSGIINTFLRKDDTLWVGTNGNGVRYSVNNGATWTDLNTGIGSYASVSQLIRDGNDIYALAGGTMYVLSPYRSFWGNAGISGTVDALFADENYLFAFSGKKLYRKTKGSGSWTVVNSNLPEIGITQTKVASTGTTLVIGTLKGVYISTDAGVTWNLTSGLPTGDYVDINGVGAVGSTIFVSIQRTRQAMGNLFLSEGGIFKSTDHGQTWLDVSDGLPRMQYNVRFMTYGGYLYISDDYSNGWMRPLSEMATGVQTYSYKTPNDFQLQQNYPNPFNPKTTIQYRIANSKYVTLKVFDLLGREIATLVNEQKSPGTYEVRFDAHNLASGVYLYQLRAGEKVETRRMVITK